MPRPTPAQICGGTLAVVSATMLLLAVSGVDGVLGITVLVVFALALGTLVTALSMTTRAGGRGSGARSPIVRRGTPALRAADAGQERVRYAEPSGRP